ncbi:sensor histidine kinase [Actinomadura rupiterrae]|uniref:sensor histidine kinase n=1 Tax=Actinomadura rupiterrae TaxID=559627 RepID=UPI0020A26AD9|nr:sensor histidine kinase [Actinomadura rupiterrae]MCP2335072.1 signal transduction histidine kinase [Actinomadura rupiterrae]
MSVSAPSAAPRRLRPRLRPAAWPVWIVPAFLAAFQVVGTEGAAHNRWRHDGQPMPTGTRLDAFAFVLILGGPAVLLLRRRHPVVALAATGVITGLYFLRAYPYGPVPLAAFVAILAALYAGHRREAWAGTLGGLAVFFAVAQAIGVAPEERGAAGHLFPVPRPDLPGVLFALAWVLVVLVTGELMRMRAQRSAAAERSRAERERRQASEERLRMARELHDVLAHNVSMINVRAGVALHLLDDDPAEARAALTAIKEASKEVLTEMRSVIGALRAQDESAPRSPTAGLARLDELASRARASGLRVEAETTGAVRPLPAALDLAAFRIVQESLTNAAKHGGPGPVTVRVLVAYGEHELTVRVEDDGRGAASPADPPDPEALPSSGSGLRGMRERAAALGGSFRAGPRPGGGFRVEAVLPVDVEEERA